MARIALRFATLRLPIFLTAVLAAMAVPAAAQIPAFPGAEGFGAYATGGRGGDVYVVTNLNSSGAGSFYEGITTIPAAGRTVVFAVSGQIHLAGGNSTRITGNKLTIAGQTAPGDGILLKDGCLVISGDDIVIRHLRFRHGKYGSGGDCIDLDSGCNNAILDHLSLAFSTDENISSFSSPPENLTMQWSFNAWGLESHSCGGLWDQNHATCHHSLWAHNHTRNPKARPNGLLEWTNNVTFDWDIGFIMGDSSTPAAWKSNVRSNYFICPPGNIRNTPLQGASLASNGVPNFSVYQDNNLHDNNGDTILNGTNRGDAIISGSPYNATTNPTGNYYKLPSPVAGSALLNIESPFLAYKKIVSAGGALRPDNAYNGTLRDEVDTRLVHNLTTLTRNHITRETDLAGVSNNGFGSFAAATPPIDSDKDGMPDNYENALGWNPGVKDHNTTVSGTVFFPAGYSTSYTRLEEYLHFKSIPHLMLQKNAATTPDIDLTRYTSGFTSTPVFTLTGITGGTAIQSGTGGNIVHFTANNTAGRGGFLFTVTDSQGSAWTQQFAICITNSGAPTDLTWRGSGATWDTSSSNWLKNGAAAGFSSGDRVTFDHTGAAAANVTIPAAITATSIDVNATTNYTFSGAGSISSTNLLTKRGSGTLTISNSAANSFSGVSLEEGTLAITSGSALGTAPVTLAGGIFNIGATAPTGNALTIAGRVTIIGGSGSGLTGIGFINGSGPLTIQATNVFDLRGDMTGYSGKLTLTGNHQLRFNGTTGSSTATFDLGSGTNSIIKRNSTTTIQLGSLVGGANTSLSGAGGSGNTTATTYVIGSTNGSTTFAGTISNGGGTTGITKTGSGTLTLGGSGSYTGATMVSQGTLLVDGSLGNTAVTVANGSLLGGDGSIAGMVTASAGAFISPGTVPYTGATFTLGGGLALNGNTLYYDMSDSPAGANDRIAMSGALTMTGTPNFQFLLLQNTLGEGTYDLISGASTISASGYTLAHNLPVGTRQTFALSTVGTTIRLTVTGNPATLTWTGAASANWDTTTANNWSGATPATFGTNDAVIFNDAATVLAITPVGTVQPRSTLVNNSTKAFTFGAGIGGGDLTKIGTNTLTLTGANSHAGTILNAGTIQLASAGANAAALGTGVVTLNGGALKMYSAGDGTGAGTLPNTLKVAGNATFQPAPRGVFSGDVSGAGTLNYLTTYVRADITGDWSSFTGNLNVTTDAGGGDFRITADYSWPGLPAATVNLAANTWFYHAGILAAGAGTTIEIGAFNGAAGSHLRGGVTGGRALTYRIGGKSTDSTFAGVIEEQNASTATNYVKTGTGTWTLSGTGTWNGGTTVAQGSLKIAGTMNCKGSSSVSSGARLILSGGSFSTESLAINSGALLEAHGNLTTDLNCDGTYTARGYSTGTPGTLAITGSAVFGDLSTVRLRVGPISDTLTTTADLSLAGTLNVTLAPDITFGRFRLFNYGGTLDPGTIILTGFPTGITASLSTSIPGGVDLIINDSDEDALPDTWEIANFGNLNQSATGDFDNDGTSNRAEYRLGLDPASGSSSFRATPGGPPSPGFTLTWPAASGLTFRVERSPTITGSWTSLSTVIATSAIGSFTDPAPPAVRGFYRIELLDP